MSYRAYAASICKTALCFIASPMFAYGQVYDVPWHTIDGGGEMFSTGGAFSVGGTIGQPDAGVMTGGVFELTGGFWLTSDQTCDLAGDAIDLCINNATMCIHRYGGCMDAPRRNRRRIGTSPRPRRGTAHARPLAQ
ncbi:MAG: hypothetical protein ACKVS9_19605 [Phycisphaerae bacterium]